MNNDFRITCDSFDHPKLVKLQRICGEHGVLCLFRLWGFTARYHPRGDFDDMTDEDIEIAAKWNGDPGVFFSALIKFQLLDETLGSYSIHDWEDHNAFAFHAPERSAKAKNAARIRWECDGDASNNATGNAPSPSPKPLPNPKDKPSKSDGVNKPAVKKKGMSIEDQKPKTDGGKLIKFWHTEYRAIHDRGYSGDIRRMQGQIKILLRKVSYKDIGAGMTYLLHQDTTEFLFHTFDHFIRKANEYIDLAEKGRYEI